MMVRKGHQKLCLFGLSGCIASWFELFKSMSPMILSVPADMGYDQYTKTHPCSFVATSDEASNDFTLIIMKKFLCQIGRAHV